MREEKPIGGLSRGGPPYSVPFLYYVNHSNDCTPKNLPLVRGADRWYNSLKYNDLG